MKLTLFVGLYLLCTVAIGLFAATRVRSTTDYALAGRSLPLVMVITATFATWFGSETVLGLPGQFIKNGLEGVVEEPFGSSMALILVGMFFARKLYRMSLLTIGDFYRRRYGVSVELCCSIFVVLSYLGWVAAQVAALGLVIHLLTEGYVSVSNAMIVGTIVVLIYTVFGGMWSVALTDFFQMIIIVIGLVLVAYFAGSMAGGPGKVTEYAVQNDLFRILPENNFKSWMFWISAAITMMIGSLPQQDVFQRVMSAKSEKIACYGPILGGSFYLLFAFVPMFIVIAATVGAPELASKLMADAPQEILPTFIKEYMPLWLRIMFFGAVLSAVMSTASATMLAPTTTFVENVLRNLMPLSDQRELKSDAYLSRSVRHWRSDLRASHGRYTDLRTCGNGLSVSGNRRILAFDSWSLLETFDHVGMLAFHYRRFCRLGRAFLHWSRGRVPGTARRIPGGRNRTDCRLSPAASHES